MKNQVLFLILLMNIQKNYVYTSEHDTTKRYIGFTLDFRAEKDRIRLLSNIENLIPRTIFTNETLYLLCQNGFWFFRVFWRIPKLTRNETIEYLLKAGIDYDNIFACKGFID